MARNMGAKNSCAKKIRTLNDSRVLSMQKKSGAKKISLKGSAKMSVITLTFLVISLFVLSGFFYLYQVNDLATKGFEIRDAENKIKELEEESKKLKIRETELRSMYTIEKETQDLNLINSTNISYVEINGPIAMK